MTFSPEIEERVEDLLRQLTLQEKIALLSGRDSWNTAEIQRLGLPPLTMTDGPNGPRTNQPDSGRPVSTPTTAFPTGVSMASTWNPQLVEQAAAAMGDETLAAGCDILLGPCVNIVRTPIAGRNFESYSEDPYLAGQIGAAFVRGLQSRSVGASLKHYAANNQEIERFRGSSEVDERTLREIYLPHFETIVKETQPWTVMCSYNRINGVYASQNHHLLNEILKDEWGFEGAVISDWGANHTITESVQGGLDVEMPGPAKYYGSLLLEAVNNWQIEEAVIDEAARRVLRIIVRSGRLDAPRPSGKLNTPEHQALARRAAEEAITLLKNQDQLLPLQPEKLQTVAVIGLAAAEPTISGGGSSYVEPPYRSTPLAALQESLGSRVEVRYEPGADNFVSLPILKSGYVTPAVGEGSGLYGEYFANPDFSGEPLLKRVDPRLDFWWFQSGPANELGENFSIRWTGKLSVLTTGRYTLRVAHTSNARLYLDDRLLIDSHAAAGLGDTQTAVPEAQVELTASQPYNLRLELSKPTATDYTHVRLFFAATPEHDDRLERAVALAREADVALVFVGTTEDYETEGADRPTMDLPGKQNELVRRVCEANPRTVVVLNAGSPVSMPWIDSAAAVLQAYLPGMEGGNAITRVLLGEVNPSGKLTVTYPRRLEDTPSFPNLSYPGAREVRYGEGIFVGYRYFDQVQSEPLFPFGYGLSYTTFAYSNLQAPDTVRQGETFTVKLTVTNTGDREGKEVVQLYVADRESSLVRPPKELKGFAKVNLQPGESQEVTLTLNPRSLAFFDPLRGWVAEPGEFEILAGASSRDIRLKKVIRLVEG